MDPSNENVRSKIADDSLLRDVSFFCSPFLVVRPAIPEEYLDFVAEQKGRINDNLLALLIKTSGPFVIFINDTRRMAKRKKVK